MQFNEFVRLQEEHENGTYVCTHVKKEHAKIIIDTLAKHGVKNLVHPDELHITIIYSKTPCLKAYNLQLFEDFETKFSARNFEIFVKDEKVLVIKGWSTALEDINERLMKNGATSDFHEYNPHITVSLDTDIDEVSVSAMGYILQEIEEKLTDYQVSLQGITVKPITNAGYTVKMNDGRVIQK